MQGQDEGQSTSGTRGYDLILMAAPYNIAANIIYLLSIKELCFSWAGGRIIACSKLLKSGCILVLWLKCNGGHNVIFNVLRMIVILIVLNTQCLFK